MSGQDKVLISDMMGSFVSEAPPIPFVSYCVVCNVFLTKDEMVYEKGHVFHKECFDEHGKDFPEVNRELVSQNSNAKVQLIQLKNLKIRQQDDTSKKRSVPKTKKTKSKKKRPKRKTVKKRTPSRRKKTKRRSGKKRSHIKRRTATKKRKKTSRKIRRKPARRRTSKRKTRRR